MGEVARNLDQEAWLAANTFRCERLKASITPAQCEANRKLPEGGGWDGENSIKTRPPQCNGCEDWKEAEMGPMRGDCPRCGRKDVAMPSKISCARCYDRAKKGLPLRDPEDEPLVQTPVEPQGAAPAEADLDLPGLRLVRYTPAAKGGGVAVCVNGKGLIGIYPAAWRKYDLDRFKGVILYIDKDQGVVAMRFLPDRQPGSLSLSREKKQGKGSLRIAARSFWREFGLEAKGRYPFETTEQSNLFLFRFNRKEAA